MKPRKKSSSRKHTPSVRLSRRKRILFAVLPTVFLTGAVAVTELIVRSSVPPPYGDIVREESFDGIHWLQVNRSFLARYFPPSAPSVPEWKPALFRRDKTSATFRVFCLGGSTMFGTPYVLSATVPGLVRRHLRSIRGELEIEVVNWGASAVNSNVVRDIAPCLADFEPDLVLVYMGHNEFYGPDGVGATFLERWFPALTRLKYSLMELRLVQLLHRWLRKPASVPGEDPNLMRQVSQGALVASGSAEEERIAGLFKSNLRAIVGTFRERGIPVILSEIQSNLMFPPFVSDTVVNGRDVRPVIRQVRSAFEDGRAYEALEIIDSVSSAETPCAILEYWRGRAQIVTVAAAGAARALVRARDLDMLKFRAPSAMNNVVHAVAAEEGVPVVPLDSVFQAALESGVPWDGLFWEHLHPTFFGYDQIARSFVQTLVARRLLPGGETARREPLPFQRDSLGVCWLDLAYADISIRRLTGRWPFADYLRAPAVIGSEEKMLEQIAGDTHARRITVDEGCYRSATYFWRHGRYRDAQTTYETLLDEYPYGFYPNYLLGSLLNHTGETGAALRYYRRSVESNPDFLKARLDMGLILVNTGRVREGTGELEDVLRRAGPGGPPDVRAAALYGLSAAYANQGELDQAMTLAERSLELVPSSKEARGLRDQLRRATGK